MYGAVNDWPDLDLLRSKTSLPGTAPGLPKIKIASTTRTPEAARAKLRRRGASERHHDRIYTAGSDQSDVGAQVSFLPKRNGSRMVVLSFRPL